MTRSIALALASALCCGGCADGTAQRPEAAPTTVTRAGEVVDPASETFLQSMVKEEHLSGVVLVQQRGKILHRRAYGLADIGRPNRVDGRVHVGSITKQFTAAALMQLVEQGKVRLDGKINSYLPERYRSPLWSGVTVKHLLSHSSGIPDYAETRDYYDVVDGWALGATVDGMIREAMTSPLEFSPGSRFRYSNIGFTLLGEIIAAQSGRSYETYVETELLAPAGMNDSEIHGAHYVPQPRDARGMRWDEGSRRQVKDDVVSLPVTPPDGGLVTTLDDFARWITIYRDMSHPRLSAKSIARMLDQSAPNETYRWPQQGFRGEAYYGLGVMRSGDLIMHEGYIVGFRGYFIYSRKDDLLIAVFTNTTANDVFRIASGLLRIHGKPGG